MVVDRRSESFQRRGRCAVAVALHMLLLLTVWMMLVGLHAADAGTPTMSTGSAPEREARDAFNRAEYSQVLKLWQSLPP